MRRTILSSAAMAVALSTVIAVPAGAAQSEALTARAEAALPTVVINEIHYNGANDDASIEFIELHNPSSDAVSLDGMVFTEGVKTDLENPAKPAEQGTLHGLSIPAGGYLVLGPQDNTVEATYGHAPAAIYGGKLSGKGELIELRLGELVIDSVLFDDNSPWPTEADGQGPSIELLDPLSDNNEASSWFASTEAPTPGQANNQPIVTEHSIAGAIATPAQPSPNQDFVISAAISGDGVPQLTYRVGFGSDVTIDMTPGADGTFSATVPGQSAGELIRYRIDHGDAALPVASDARRNLGVVVTNPLVTTDGAPVIEYFMADADYATMMANPLDRTLSFDAVIAYNGDVFDGSTVAIRGGDYARKNQEKQALGFDLPSGHELMLDGLTGYAIDEFALATDVNPLYWNRAETAWWVYEEAGFPNVHTGLIRLERNGDFQGVYRFQEKLDGTWRKAVGLDEGDFYKARTGGFRYRDGFSHRSGEDRSAELNAITDVIRGSSDSAKTEMLYEQFDIPALVNYMAASSIVGHYDSGYHNNYAYRNPDTELWSAYPWDINISMGANFQECKAATDADLRCVDDAFYESIYLNPNLEAMIWARMATLRDGPLASGEIESMQDARVASIGDTTAALEAAAWTGLGHIEASTGSLLRGVNAIRSKFANESRIPTLGSGSSIVISELHYEPQGDEPDFVELANVGSRPVDLSDWVLDGVFKDTTIPAGTILLPGDYLVLTKSIVELRAAYPNLPRVAVVEFDGKLKGSGEELTLLDADKVEIDSVGYTADAPWPLLTENGNRTLELIDLTSDNSEPANWKASSQNLGTPGAQNSDTVTPEPEPEPEPGNNSENTITIYASGTTGAEELQLILNNQLLDTFTITKTLKAYTFTTNQAINTIQVNFTNDQTSPADRNVYLDAIKINDTRYETEAPTTYTVGTYSSGSKCRGGNKESAWLHCNGYALFDTTPVNAPTPLPAAPSQRLHPLVNLSGI